MLHQYFFQTEFQGNDGFELCPPAMPSGSAGRLRHYLNTRIVCELLRGKSAPTALVAGALKTDGHLLTASVTTAVTRVGTAATTGFESEVSNG